MYVYYGYSYASGGITFCCNEDVSTVLHSVSISMVGFCANPDLTEGGALPCLNFIWIGYLLKCNLVGRLWQHWNRTEATRFHIFVKIVSSIQKAKTLFFPVLNKSDRCFQFLYFCDTEQMCSGLKSSLASTYHFHINESQSWINKLMVKMTIATWAKQHNWNAQTHICAKCQKVFLLRARLHFSIKHFLLEIQEM